MSPINTYTLAVGQSAAGSFPEQRLVIESRVKVVWCNNGTHKSRWKHWKNRLLWKKKTLTLPSRFWTGWTPQFKAFRFNIRELRQQRRRRLQKRHLKSEFAPLQTLSRIFHLVYFVKRWQMFLELNSKGLYQSSGKEKKVVVLCSRPRQNVNSGTFTL